MQDGEAVKRRSHIRYCFEQTIHGQCPEADGDRSTPTPGSLPGIGKPAARMPGRGDFERALLSYWHSWRQVLPFAEFGIALDVEANLHEP